MQPTPARTSLRLGIQCVCHFPSEPDRQPPRPDEHHSTS
jgi:hypothetical protein